MRMRRSKKKIVGPSDGTSERDARALYLDDAPRDFGPEVAFSLSIASLSVASRTGIEGEKRRPLDHV